MYTSKRNNTGTQVRNTAENLEPSGGIREVFTFTVRSEYDGCYRP